MKLDGRPALDVTVRCDGASLPEYMNEADARCNSSVGVSYIEATSGSNFTIYFKADKYEYGKWPHIVCEIKLDGQVIQSSILEVNSSRHYRNELKGAYGIDDGQEVLRRFKFADLRTNDGHADHAKLADFKNLGEIEINLISGRKTAQIMRSKVASMAESSIPEKALKGRAISNRAALDKAEPTAPSSTWSVEYEGNQRRSFATYIFKYRSRRDLQIEDMIPSTPTPTPLEERDPNDLTLEEARELLRLKRIQESKAVKVKKEKRRCAAEDDDEDDGEMTITEERKAKRARESTDSGIEIVDLTDD